MDAFELAISITCRTSTKQTIYGMKQLFMKTMIALQQMILIF